jgi:hypothetical protein
MCCIEIGCDGVELFRLQDSSGTAAGGLACFGLPRCLTILGPNDFFDALTVFHRATSHQELLMVQGQKKSTAIGTDCDPIDALLHVGDELFQIIERLSIHRVIHPTSFAAIIEQAGILQDLQMERQSGLRALEQASQFTNTVFAALQPFQQVQSRRIGQGMKEGSRFVTF